MFNAVQAGEHEVRVRRAENEISGSPFRAMVSEVELACADGVKVYGRGLTEGETGQPCQFFIDTSHAGIWNQLPAHVFMSPSIEAF